MKQFILLLCTAFSLQTSAQQSISWFKSYAGSIGNTPFTLLLHKAGNDYDGFVYYSKTEQPYAVSASNQQGTAITLTGAPDGSEQTEKWQLKITGTGITGSFTMNKKTTALVAKETNAVPGAFYVYTSKKERLNAADKASPTASYFESGIWFQNNQALNKLLWPGMGKKTAGQVFLENRNTFFADYREELKEVTPADYKESSYMYTRESLSKTLIRYVSANLLVFSTDNYGFFGGAHGMFGTDYQVIDKRTNTTLTLDNLISDTAALVPLLEKNFRLQQAVPANQTLMEYGLFVNTIPVNDNFLLTEKYLAFTYNPYEIAPYSGGQITIYIPVSECKDLLTEQAKGLFTKL
ncbi:MAG: RsiV family protein [Bacteroidetes bacterium]|nr:RsiV family protein [Bacteroidota bacterium]